MIVAENWVHYCCDVDAENIFADTCEWEAFQKRLRFRVKWSSPVLTGPTPGDKEPSGEGGGRGWRHFIALLQIKGSKYSK